MVPVGGDCDPADARHRVTTQGLELRDLPEHDLRVVRGQQELLVEESQMLQAGVHGPDLLPVLEPQDVNSMGVQPVQRLAPGVEGDCRDRPLDSPAVQSPKVQL